ncbi:alkyl hydroperoxide reductase subunit F [Myxococcota bacterium]|nr:alkyl hydroperoxide reductase subunit F [Myxococcota bacterium]
MLDNAIKTQLVGYFQNLKHPVELVATLDGSEAAAQLKELIGELAELSDKLTARYDGTDARKPSFSVAKAGEAPRVRFAGIPLGHELSSLVLALLQVGGHPPKVSAELIERIKALPGRYAFETFVSLSCQNCPEVVQSLNLMAVLNPNITHTMVDGALFQDEVAAKEIMSVPSAWLDGKLLAQGRMNVEEILAKIDTGAEARAAAALANKEPFDVLIIGGGPTGAAAAIYAARKGIRTGVVAERFGGQVLDTLAIENFISVQHTEGPKLAASLENHVREYGVDIIGLQRVERITPAKVAGDFADVKLASGATLKAKSIVLATGARWRELDVPGEREYKGHGVAYCPHCDGPLFKGKRVAVVGGGNSGVEAAIDLAGLTSHVTLIEFDAKLRADAVLQKKLATLPNVTVVTSAKTTEVTGDGKKVNGLVYEDRTTGQRTKLELEGVFVQIGLIPNTSFLEGTVALSRRGEIEVDAKGATSAMGIFAGGDATTTPYKQIIIAMGEGAKAALSAFDYLVRS